MIYTIFLDIDGVLNSLDNQRSLDSNLHSHMYGIDHNQYKSLNANALKYSLHGEGNYKFDERCVRHFNNVCRLIHKIDKEANIQIVLTSAWQYMGIAKFNEIWDEECMFGTVVDFIKNYNPDRGEGILKYLETHNIYNNWASVDDDGFTYLSKISETDKHRIVIPNSNLGISYENSNQLLYALTDGKYNDFLQNQ